MTVNLINPLVLKDTMTNLVFGEEKTNGLNVSDLKSYDFVDENKDRVIRTMIYQWAKLRLRDHLLKEEKAPFLKKIGISDDLPDWAKDSLKSGKDVYEFVPDKISDKQKSDFSETVDFLYAMADNKVKSVLAGAKNHPKHKMPSIGIDYLKTVNEYDTYAKTKHASDKWHELLAIKSKKGFDKSASETGVKTEMEFPDGMKIVRLLTEEALDFESERMGHCLGAGAYDSGVKGGLKEIYSLRDKSGEAHVTIEAIKGEIFQCKGKGNKPLATRYIPYAREFIKRKNYGFNGDYKHLGYLKNDRGFFDIFDMPKDMNLSFDKIDISGMGLAKMPDLSNVTTKEFDCSDNRFPSLTGMPKVSERVDCSNNPNLESLAGLPERLDGCLVAKNTGIKNLIGAPTSLSACDVSKNPNLNDLTGSPKNMVGSLDLTDNNFDENATSPEYVKDIRYINGLDREKLDKMIENAKKKPVLDMAKIKANQTKSR